MAESNCRLLFTRESCCHYTKEAQVIILSHHTGPRQASRRRVLNKQYVDIAVPYGVPQEKYYRFSCSEFFDTTAAMASESHATLHPYVWPTPVSLFMY